MKIRLHIAIIAGVFFLPMIVSAMSSSNYSIPLDAVDSGGGFSTSSNYRNEDTYGESATGYSTSTNYALAAGYQQMFGSYISISSPADNSLPTLNGFSGGVSTSSLVWNVLTDNPAGYSLSIQATTQPALKSVGASFADYAPAGSNPDFAFTIGAASSSFGFSPQGTDIITKYRDNGSSCNTGSSDTVNACWDGLSTTPKVIAQSTASNQPSGTDTSVLLEAKIGASKLQDSGAYSMTIVVTAVTL
jgi:hypothetical protein